VIAQISDPVVWRGTNKTVKRSSWNAKEGVSLFDGNIRPSKDMDLRAFLRF